MQRARVTVTPATPACPASGGVGPGGTKGGAGNVPGPGTGGSGVGSGGTGGPGPGPGSGVGGSGGSGGWSGQNRVVVTDPSSLTVMPPTVPLAVAELVNAVTSQSGVGSGVLCEHV